MRRPTRWLMLGLPLLVATLVQAAPVCRLAPDSVTLGNSQLRREWVKRDGRWSTARLVRGDGQQELAVAASEEFLVKVYEGATISGATCPPATVAADKRPGETGVSFTTADPASGLKITVRYWLCGEQPWMRKAVTVAGPAGVVIDEIEVEHLAIAAPTALGGFGQPLYLGDAWFTGLEYPAGYNEAKTESGARPATSAAQVPATTGGAQVPATAGGAQVPATAGGAQVPALQGATVTLHHYPGREAAGGLTSKTAVLGVTPPGLTRELAFSDYLDTVRIQTRDFLQYNSWYDLRSGEMTIPNIERQFAGFKAKLLDPYGLKMGAFVPDDGWQDGNSIWQPVAARYPQGFRPLAESLERSGSRLGIWMPLNGFNLNAKWGEQQGFEVSDQGPYYCLAAPKYNAEIRKVTAQRIRDGNLSYYKHDFNQMQCSAPGHGHLPTARHGREACMDAEIGLLAWEREVQPGIFLNVTSNVWLSPWWLQYADSIWMCAGDFGYDKSFPQLSPREWDMSYRDAHFYNVYLRQAASGTQANFVPLSALMTHGIIHGRLCKLGGDQETLREFSDMTVLYYARGVQLKELYISPEIMDAERWQVLGEATRWAVENHEVLRRTVMIGGDVRRGEPYGYVHWQGDRGLIVLRNPAPERASIRVPFDQSVYYRGAVGRPFAARVIYPYYGAGTSTWTSGRTRSWLVPGCSVVVLDVRPGAARPPLDPEPRGRLWMELPATVPVGTPGVDIRFILAPEQMPRCDLYLLLRGSGQTDLKSVTINGQPAKGRGAQGPGWRLSAFDVRPLAGQAVTVEVRLPAAEDRPFAVTRCPLEAWLVADRPTGAPLAVARTEHTPYPIAQGYARDTRFLLQTTVDTGGGAASVHLSDAELAGVKAARLRLEVFDANGDGPYADKWIILNGERLARVPANKGELSAWQECFLDLPAAFLGKLRRENTVVLGNAGGDCYKFRGVGLALQRADGKWVTTAVDGTVYSTVENWLYSEGTMFRGDSSPEIRVVVP